MKLVHSATHFMKRTLGTLVMSAGFGACLTVVSLGCEDRGAEMEDPGFESTQTASHTGSSEEDSTANRPKPGSDTENDDGDDSSGATESGDGDSDRGPTGPRADVEYKLDLSGQSVPCWSDVDGASNEGCKTFESCPSPDDSKDPEVTCHQPQWVFYRKEAVVHMYGKYLVNEDGPPKAVAYRDTDTSGPGAATTEDVTVHSDCHVSFELSVGSMPGMKCGDSVEFRLVRQPRARDEPRSAAMMSDWRTLKVTKKPGSTPPPAASKAKIP